MHDLVIRGGLVVDGTGSPSCDADVAVDGDRIAYVGSNADPGAEEIDAKGRIVTPGFVDLHTHYDAQVMWDPILAPTSWNGVTTIVMGNCAVGFAPARPESRPFLMEVMEAVEEIPRPVLEAGLDWDWESFPDYLDAIDRRLHTVDIGAQVANVALRNWVLGDRSDSEAPASEAEIAAMTGALEDALRAGALGLSFSRTDFHRMQDGRVIPGTNVPAEEALGLCDALARVGDRVIQYLGNPRNLDDDMQLIRQLARRSGCAVHFPLTDIRWRERVGLIDSACEEGLSLYAQVPPRGQGVVVHWGSATRPFENCPSFRAIADLPWPAQLKRLKDPERRAAILAEFDIASDPLFKMVPLERLFESGTYPDYEPDPETDSIAARVRRTGEDPGAVLYDSLMANDGEGMLMGTIFNYAAGDLSDVRQMLLHPGTIPSMSDSGAHGTRVIDAGQPTFMLAHWVRDRTRGEKLPLESSVKGYTLDAARSYGLLDRGVLAPGYLADLNVIDLDRVRLPAPYRAWDLPQGGQRLLQQPEGYIATVKRGDVTFRDGEHCGRFPGRLIRGAQPAPAG